MFLCMDDDLKIGWRTYPFITSPNNYKTIYDKENVLMKRVRKGQISYISFIHKVIFNTL
jgi:hypothetical protein